MTAIENAKFERCADLLAQYIEKYADKLMELIEEEKKSEDW